MRRALLISLLLHALLLGNAPPWQRFRLAAQTGSANSANAVIRARMLLPPTSPVTEAVKTTAPAEILPPALAQPLLSAHPVPPARKLALRKPKAAQGAGRTEALTPATTTPIARDEAEGRLSADDQRQYRMSLAIAARRFKHYPPAAHQNGQEGTVEIALVFHESRPFPETALLRSSGHRLLDDEALTMMQQASRNTPLPDGLRGKNFQMKFPVQFSLD